VFWNILGKLLGFDPASSYEQRIAMVQAANIAIWDVLKACTREGSLDSDIDKSSVVPNEFQEFFAKRPHIRKICFNGTKAEKSYMKHVRPRLTGYETMKHIRLPSTSPAFAAMSLAQKERAWSAILD
jgi:hypoxanthine-DNA glycosylase